MTQAVRAQSDNEQRYYSLLETVPLIVYNAGPSPPQPASRG